MQLWHTYYCTRRGLKRVRWLSFFSGKESLNNYFFQQFSWTTSFLPYYFILFICHLIHVFYSKHLPLLPISQMHLWFICQFTIVQFHSHKCKILCMSNVKNLFFTSKSIFYKDKYSLSKKLCYSVQGTLIVKSIIQYGKTGKYKSSIRN